MTKLLVCFVPVFALLAAAVAADAQVGCGRQRQAVVYRQAAVQQYQVAAPVYQQAYVQQQVYAAPVYNAIRTVVLPVKHQVDFQYSVNDYSRDKLLIDALAGRLLDLKKQGVFEGDPPAVPPSILPQRQRLPNRMPQAEPDGSSDGASLNPADPKLAALVTKTCLKCHQQGSYAPGTTFNMSNLDIVPQGKRWEMHGLVLSGEMPKGGKEVADDDTKLFYDYARLARKK